MSAVVSRTCVAPLERVKMELVVRWAAPCMIGCILASLGRAHVIMATVQV